MGNLFSSGLSGIILAGGLSRRMAQDKAWLVWNGQPLLSHVVQTLRPWVEEVLVSARPGQLLPPVPARVVTDRMEGAGPLGGLEAGLSGMRTPYALAVACDMPWLSPDLIKAMVTLAPGWDLVIPRAHGSLQPLHSIYARRLLSRVTDLLDTGERRLHVLAAQTKARVLEESFVRAYDPCCLSLKGLNTWEEYKKGSSYPGGQLEDERIAWTRVPSPR